jgi:DNA repair protein RecO (recombination protein O)
MNGPRISAAVAGRRHAGTVQPAYLLHSHDWSESSLIVELFTREAGRAVAVAKGAKRPTSQLRAVLLPFQRIGVQFARVRRDAADEVRTLRSAEWGGSTVPLQGAAWFAGFHLNELLLRLLPRDDAHPTLFDVYAATLPELSAGDTRSESALRAFELLLLRESGVLPEFDCTTLTQAPVLPVRRYALRPEKGLVEAAVGEPALSGATCLGIAAALAHWPADAERSRHELQQVCCGELMPLRTLLRSHLHYHLGGAALRTRQVMIDAQRLLESGTPQR